MEIKFFSHGVGQNSYHFVWKPRFAYKLFANVELKFACENVLRAICFKHGFEIFEFEVMPDHIHLFLDIGPKVAVCKAFQFLKGISSKHLRKCFPYLHQVYWKGGMWSKGKFFRSVGNVTADVIQNYIAQSQDKPKFNYKAFIRKARHNENRMKAQTLLQNYVA